MHRSKKRIQLHLNFFPQTQFWTRNSEVFLSSFAKSI
jgi:hypothetical protein